MGDQNYHVNLSFFGTSVKIADNLKVGDVISLKDVQIYAPNDKDTSVHPGSLTYKDYGNPQSSFSKLSDKEIPDDLSYSLTKKLEGTVVDLTNYKPYMSCKGNGGKCKAKVVPNQNSCSSCKNSILPEDLFEDYIIDVVLWTGTETTIAKCFRYKPNLYMSNVLLYISSFFRRSLLHLEKGNLEGKDRLAHLEGQEIYILVPRDSSDMPVAESIDIV